jgi:glutamate dehydrogenase
MSGTIPAARKHIIDEIVAEARKIKNPELPVSHAVFTREYFHGVSEEDLKTGKPAGLAAAAMGHLEFGRVRRDGEARVRVFNPSISKDGWESPFTIVEIVTEDMPFLIDSLAMLMNEAGLEVQLMVHPVLRVTRDGRGRLTRVEPAASGRKGTESWQHVEVDRISGADEMAVLRARIFEMLENVRISVEDWPQMRDLSGEIGRSLLNGITGISRVESTEASEFLDWLANDHFTFLGYREYRLERGRKVDRLVALPASGLGLLRTGAGRPKPKATQMEGDFRDQAREPTVLVVTKANSVSPVHRATYLDYVGIKTFDPRGRVVGERRFIGLFTSKAYMATPWEIPLLRRKVQRVMEHFGVSPVSHDGKALVNVLETYPRDELFQSSVAELVRTTRGIVNMYERRRVRLFPRRDPYGRFYSCMLFVPRDRYNTQARERIEQILMEELHGTDFESQVEISISALARLRTIVRTDPAQPVRADVARIERRIDDALLTWSDRLRDEINAHLPGDQAAPVATEFATAFPAAYEEEVKPADAITDILELIALRSSTEDFALELRAGDAAANTLHLRLYQRTAPAAMSDMLPLLENFGLRILNERPYRVLTDTEQAMWIQDLEVTHERGRSLDPDEVGARFEEAFYAVTRGDAESDGFNRLVFAANLDWRQVVILRAVCRYLLQTGLPFSQPYMESVLSSHPDIGAALVSVFEARFDPDVRPGTKTSRLNKLKRSIRDALEQVTSPDDDRILRAFRSVIMATLRTNHYQRMGDDGKAKPYLCLKLDPHKIAELPKPRPMFEIWVYSPRVEGVHLRMGKVARGGLRWSDRREDFRTEVLGLMKAQNVKNTLIVPVGAKGGFVPKLLPQAGTREEIQREGTESYKCFIRALLDITDNVLGQKIIPPERTVRYDEDDPYLVVAADKGTASFSDTANELAAEYGFWLGDAFASGGSVGYDHKTMGITARGAWECVKRHFRELGIDIQTEDFTVAGIGDMGGDVFGNGMLLSEHIRLVAAFNHQHIFIDPDPDARRSYRERERLFKLPRSSWEDYDSTKLSKGGAILSRRAKEVTLSAQARAVLGLESSKATPQEVIRAILKMPVDLLWNGGIGTYVKASHETNADAGDRSNDAVRVNGNQLRCRVVGEGGNLGVTQLGRVEFSLNGGYINTDFLDNSGGVDASDHEVNIKILLDIVRRKKKLSSSARIKLLAEMTDEVAGLVLRDNYLQSQAISLQQSTAAARLGEHAHFVRQLELDGILDRTLEFLPNAEDIEERHRLGLGLTAPELCMVLSYAKIALNAQLILSDVPEDPYLGGELGRYFPERLTRRYAGLLEQHPLKREIIATATTNSIVNRMGPTFVARGQQETGADAATVARAYTIAREAFDAREVWSSIEALDNRAPADVQYSMTLNTIGLLRQASYWLIERHRNDLGINRQVERFRPGIRELCGSVGDWLTGLERERFDNRVAELLAAGAPADLAARVAALSALKSAPDIVELGVARKLPVVSAAQAYFHTGEAFGLDWLRQAIELLEITGLWQAVARGSLREAIYETHRGLAERIQAETRERDPIKAIEAWKKSHRAETDHALNVINDIRGQPTPVDFASLSVGLQTIRRLVIA